MEITCSETSNDPQWDNELYRVQQQHFEGKRSHLIDFASQTQAHRRKLRHEQSILNSLPLDLLAKEWLDHSGVSLSTRAYLVSHLLPTLIMGMDDLLVEVSKQGLDDEPQTYHSFNPIDFLARYLMRNNPKYSSNPPAASPYNRSMRRIADELNALLRATEDSGIATLKAESKQRTQQRLRQQEDERREEDRRTARLDEVFKHWELGAGEGVPTNQVAQALRAWTEENGNDNCCAGFSPGSDNAVLFRSEFIHEMMKMALILPADTFNALAEYLCICGKERTQSKMKRDRMSLFAATFNQCASHKDEGLDRIRILYLLARFYGATSQDVQEKLRNPRRWPLAEPIEGEEWEEEDEIPTPTSLSDQDSLEVTSPSHTTLPTRGDTAGSCNNLKDTTAPSGIDNGGGVAKVTSIHSHDKGSGQVADFFNKAPSQPDKPVSPETSKAEKLRSHRTFHASAYCCKDSPISRMVTASRRTASILKSRLLSGMTSRAITPTGPGGVWNHSTLTQHQFMHLVDLFLGEESPRSLANELAVYLKDNYVETKEEQAERLKIAQQYMAELHRHQQVDAIFTIWDNDHSSYIECEELKLVLGRWKGTSIEQAQEEAAGILASCEASQGRLSRNQFHMYIEQLMASLAPEKTEEFLELLSDSVKLTFEELHRGKERQGLLEKISFLGKTGGLCPEKAMCAAIGAIKEDALMFGDSKRVGVAVALLSDSNVPHLHFKASTNECKDWVVGRKLDRLKAQVSFQAVDTAHPIHVPDIRKHGAVFFFCPEHNSSDEYNGSLLVAPIINPHQKVIGTFSVDTLTDDDNMNINFRRHELHFYQGVGSCLGEVLSWIDVRQKLVDVSRSALSWIHLRCSQVSMSHVYLVEPSEVQGRCALRKVLSAGPEGIKRVKVNNNSFTIDDNLFREYLFQCVEHSECTSAYAYGWHHIAHPLRDHTGCAVAVVDIATHPDRPLGTRQASEVARALKMLTAAFHRLSATGSEDEVQSVDILFTKLMLAELKECVIRLDNRILAELRSYTDPPQLVQKLVHALLYIVYPHVQHSGEWKDSKQYITSELLKTQKNYNPFDEPNHPHLQVIKQIVGSINPQEIDQHGSIPAKYIYSWTSVCTSLLEHSNASKEDSKKPSLSLEEC